MRLIDADLLEPDAEYDDGEFWAYSKRQIEEAPSAQPTPCDVCRYNPPSSMDGKPCCVCPAERRTEG